MAAITRPWRIIDLINWGTDRFAEKGISNARREMEWFLCDILDSQRIDLYIQFEDLLHENDLIKLRQMVQRRLSGEPFQHILGKGSFYARDFRVDNNVLIPRPETELLIERLKARGKVNSLLDIGTGTGCIAITASLEKLAENLFATDSSVSALSVAKENMKIFNVTNVQMAVHNFLHNRFKSKFDVAVSNPPYISVDDMSFLQKEVKDYDPSSALTDNADGLSFYRRFAEQFDNLLISGGVLLLEFGGNGQKDDIEKIFNGGGLKAEFFKDLQKKWRVVEVYR
jgi:release factor glutamine methyltransferase